MCEAVERQSACSIYFLEHQLYFVRKCDSWYIDYTAISTCTEIPIHL